MTEEEAKTACRVLNEGTGLTYTIMAPPRTLGVNGRCCFIFTTNVAFNSGIAWEAVWAPCETCGHPTWSLAGAELPSLEAVIAEIVATMVMES